MKTSIQQIKEYYVDSGMSEQMLEAIGYDKKEIKSALKEIKQLQTLRSIL